MMVTFPESNIIDLSQYSEVPYLVRYFLQYPSQTQVVDEILPEIEKLDLDDKKGKEFVQLEAFEKHLLTSKIFINLNLISFEK